ncbi:hypothetical protein ASD25_12705 [Brevundimonas sp. Root1423]|nr:hypothetical protein ASD25_12705 [Brevundimonas sp. Root1423]
MGDNKRVHWLLAGLSICAIAGTAEAQTTAFAAGQGSPNNIVLAIPVTASIGGSCGFETNAAPNAVHAVADADQGFLRDTAFTLNCSGPSRIAVVSQNGGLVAAGQAPAGYTLTLPYSVDVTMAATNGDIASAVCLAESLTTASAAPCSFRGTASLTTGLRLGSASVAQGGSRIRVSAPAFAGGAVPMASTAYTDTLIVTLGASL